MFLKSVFVASMTVLFATSALGRDEHLKFSIAKGIAATKSENKLDKNIKLVWGSDAESTQQLGTFTANRKSNAIGKSDEEACERAFMSAVISLQDRAKSEGGNAVVNIRSVYRKTNLASSDKYICGAGKMMAGVALEGTVVKLK
jgi:uncharacterized protein YbjQ (UPF0145 family)